MLPYIAAPWILWDTSSSQFFTPLIPHDPTIAEGAKLPPWALPHPARPGPRRSSRSGQAFGKAGKPCAGTLKFDWCLFQPHETTKRRKIDPRHQVFYAQAMSCPSTFWEHWHGQTSARAKTTLPRCQSHKPSHHDMLL